ncbi:hypothetical protein AAHE18_03G226500 [Arachis hypogaea]
MALGLLSDLPFFLLRVCNACELCFFYCACVRVGRGVGEERVSFDFLMFLGNIKELEILIEDIRL